MTAERTRESISAVCACVRCSVGNRKVIASKQKTRHRRFVGICEGVVAICRTDDHFTISAMWSKKCYAKQRRHPAEKSEVQMHGLIFVIIKRELVQLFEVKELSQRHIERSCDLMQVHNARIPGPAVYDIVDGRLAYIAHLCELIDRDPALLAQATNALCVQISVNHISTPILSLLPKFR